MKEHPVSLDLSRKNNVDILQIRHLYFTPSFNLGERLNLELLTYLHYRSSQYCMGLIYAQHARTWVQVNIVLTDTIVP